MKTKIWRRLGLLLSATLMSIIGAAQDPDERITNRGDSRIALAYSAYAAEEQEFGPVAVEEITPSRGDKFTQPAPGARPAVIPPGRRQEVLRRRVPVDENTHRAIKSRARTAPAEPGENLETGPARQAPRVATSFVGLDRPSAANHGSVFFPPDTIVAKSNTRVLEAANSAVRLFTTTGGVLQTKDLNTFFSAATGNGLLFDPKVYFDRNATNRRFYIIALQTDFLSTSRIWLAVSRSSDPANLNASNWCRYNIDGRRNAGTGNASFADYPGLGAGADSLVISTNQFRFADDTFTFSIVRAIRKNLLANNAASCPAIQSAVFQASTQVGDLRTFTLQPVQHYTSPSSFSGTTNPAYLVNTLFGSSTTYRVWQVRNVMGSSPTLRVRNVNGSFTYGVQPDAPQSGSDLLLATGDNRVTQAAGLGNALWPAHGTLCNVGGGENESCVRTVRILVGQSSSGALTATLSQQTTVGGTGWYLFWPGIAVNVTEQTAIVYQRSSAASFLSARWRLKNLCSASFGAAMDLTSGTCPQEVSERTGDYTGAQTDPVNFSSFWLAGERATLIAGECQWQTRIINSSVATW